MILTGKIMKLYLPGNNNREDELIRFQSIIVVNIYEVSIYIINRDRMNGW